VVLGSGKRIFGDGIGTTVLELLDTETVQASSFSPTSGRGPEAIREPGVEAPALLLALIH
jgi:hypothetical protein